MRSHFITAAVGLTLAGLSAALPTEHDAGLYNFLSKRVTDPTGGNTCGNLYNGADKGYTCDATVNPGGCCSQYGYCGNSTDYCDTGCQSAFGICNAPTTTPDPPTEDDFTCGPANSNKVCSGALCCSQNGFCGNTTDYCDAGCQSAFGQCNDGSAGPGSGGTCGPNFNNAVCSNNQCCSMAGYCGTTSDYCADPGSCLLGFGRCDSDSTPLGPSTANAPRPALGSVTYDDDIYDCVQNNVVALTYDDGPYLYTAQLLDTLKKYGFKATFFMTGNNNGKGQIDTTAPYPDLIKRMIAEGHQVASHTWSHYSLSSSSSALRKSQMVKNEMAFNNIIGKWPTYMRPPYSDCTAASGCQADLKALGYHRVYFDLDTQDYLNPSPLQIQKSKDIVKQQLAVAGVTDYLSIQHDIVEQSVSNLTSYYYDLIKAKGWKGVTVGECLNDPEVNWYRTLGSTTPPTTTAVPTTTSRPPTTTTTRPATTTTTSRPPTTTTTTPPNPAPTCAVKNGNWCGKIDPFTNKATCTRASIDCFAEHPKCMIANIFGFGACAQWKAICSKLSLYCLMCPLSGGNCNNKNFGY